jgi:hypothetical protein
MDKLEVIELFINEDELKDGVEAISLVESPAIEENFVALNKHKVEFKTIDEEKRIVIGLALVPDKEIYRRQGEHEFNIVFSKDTVRKASELYLKRLKNNNATLEHETEVKDVSVIESWIVQDVNVDKSKLYGLNAVEGAWVVTMKIDNDKVWQDVKNGKYLGFSIEGFFSDQLEKEVKDELTAEEKEAIEFVKVIEEMINKYDNE